MNIKRMIFGEKMPDKDDPKYKERYEREVKAGRKFAETLHIDKFAASIQRFADRHRTAFLVIVFGFVVGSFAWNIYRLASSVQSQAQSTDSDRNARQSPERTTQSVGTS